MEKKKFPWALLWGVLIILLAIGLNLSLYLWRKTRTSLTAVQQPKTSAKATPQPAAFVSFTAGEFLTATAKPEAAERTESLVCEEIPSYGGTEQQQVAHPVVYLSTGIENSRCWVVPFEEPGYVAIVGGETVDGVKGGVLKAVCITESLRITVKNGFLAISPEEWAEQEFFFRLDQAEEYGWLHGTVSLQGCSDCNVQSSNSKTSSLKTEPASTTGASGERKPTGKEGSLRFAVGDEVAGWKIVLDNGKSCEGFCYLPEAPTDGTVYDGVIWPWPEEVPDEVRAKPEW